MFPVSREIALINAWLPTPGVVLVVHAAFRGLSRQGLRAEAVCEALLERLGPEGTLLMPTMTWRTVTPAQSVFDVRTTASETGTLSEVFRTTYAARRSLHSSHSVAGAGPLADLLLPSHHEGTTPCAGNSPYGLLRDWPAEILMIGVGLECCTALHHAEEVMAPSVYLLPPEQAETYTLIDRDGQRHEVKNRRHRRLPRNFPAFGPALAATGALVAGRTLGVNWLRVSASALYREAFTRLAKQREAMIGTLPPGP